MASSSSSVSVPSSSRSWKYDVFLSFRGEDTRKTFIDHLYSALAERTIRTYKDDETLPRGDTIGPSLLNAIEESQIAIIVFSKNYADSAWCLDELVHIMKCRKERGQIVFPVFYDVDPSEVRKQKRKYKEAFAKHESENHNKVISWRQALVEASNISGWEPQHIANGHEAKCIKEIVGTILDKLSSFKTVVGDENLVGMGTRLQDLKSQLEIGSGGVRMVGIWGVGGGGKTILVSSLYKEIKSEFQCHCLVDNIREESRKNGLKTLQAKIISSVFRTEVGVESVDIGKDMIKSILGNRKVLIVLDDVDHLDQLGALAGDHGWFGDGSRIIITTRDEHLLTHKVDKVYPISLLSHDEGMQLFNRYAYQKNNPEEDYKMLSELVVCYAAGLPLALKVLGSFLSDKDKDEWISALARLDDIPEMEIVEKLKISYDGLKPAEKELFLDIACFFRWESKVKAMKILDACGFHSRISMTVLIQKALISITDGKIDMHDMVQEMGHYIVRGEPPFNPEKHSRVWLQEDIEDMCSGNAATDNDKTEAIYGYGSSGLNELVSNVKNLRLLHVKFSADEDFEAPTFMSNKLRYIYLSGYLASPFTESFQPRKLVALILKYSRQKELWKGHKYLPHLKELKLVKARALARTPDFGELPCLQKLMLHDCSNLEEIHSSLGNHSSLLYVSVKSCSKVRTFPAISQMKKLQSLELINCDELREFPKIEANMDGLENLMLCEVGIEVLPSSVGKYCTNLTSLLLIDCRYLKSIEGNFHALEQLQKFALRCPIQLEKLPKDLFKEKCCLEDLDFITSCLKRRIPPSMHPHLPRFLKKLDLSGLKLEDGEIPSEIGELSDLKELHLRLNCFSRLDFSLSQLIQLKLLDLSCCYNLVELPVLPSSLAILKADYCNSLGEIRDDIHTNCKCLCQVSLVRGSNVTDGERLLESMLQGKTIENQCMSLQLEGLEIPKGFTPPLVKGNNFTLELPQNWYNDYSGFLLCAVLTDDFYFNPFDITSKQKDNFSSDPFDITIKEKDSEFDKKTWLGYISFGSLRHTTWLDETNNSVVVSIDLLPVSSQHDVRWQGSVSFGSSDLKFENATLSRFGVRLVCKKNQSGQSETTKNSSSESSDDYTFDFWIDHDSKSLLRYAFTSLGISLSDVKRDVKRVNGGNLIKAQLECMREKGNGPQLPIWAS